MKDFSFRMTKRWESLYPRAAEIFLKEDLSLFYRAIEDIDARSKTPSLGLEVASFLIDIFPDVTTVIAGMFAESGDFFKEHEIEEQYGMGVAMLTQRFLELRFQNDSSDASRRKLLLKNIFLGLLKDYKTLFFLLADRLLHIRENFPISDEERVSFAKESFEVLSPLASRLGIHTYKEEFQDHAFRILYPNEYSEISRQMAYLLANNMGFLETVEEKISTILSQKNISFFIASRKKGLYSIFKKLQGKGLSKISDIFDVFALRIVVNTVENCYRTLGIVHQIGVPVLGRVKDYIASPKSNGYQTLHTTILIGSKDWETEVNPIEIQIRTREMHESAEMGVASHLSYKEKETGATSFLSREEWIKKLERINERNNYSNFLHDFSENIFKDRIFVFTDHGDVKELVKGSSPVDFAYAVHTEVGDRCIGARVNGKMVPLDSRLQNGDTVEILTRTNATPHEHWLSFVKSPFAKNRIRAFFRKQEKEHFFRIGKKVLNDELRRRKLPLLDQKLTLLQDFQKIYKYAKCKEDVIEAIGSGLAKPADVFQRLFPNSKKIDLPDFKKKQLVSQKHSSNGLCVAGEKGIETHVARCCNPKEGDEVIGYSTISHSISVHKKSCKFVKNFDKSRLLEVSWE